jgi:hypothetical protein
VTPEFARELLAASKVNRKIRRTAVIEYSQMMARGEWQSNGGEPIQILVDGSTGNGHHRAYAVLMYGKPVEMLVSRNVPLEARQFVDKVLKRTLEDEFRMFRQDLDYPTFRAAYMRTCVMLISHDAKITSLSEYDAWHKLFGKGIDWSVNEFCPGSKVFKSAGFAGGLAFAHRRDPKMVEQFGAMVAEGAGLRSGDPALVLRNYLMNVTTGLRMGGGFDRVVLGRKTINAFDAFRNGQRLSRLGESPAVFREYAQVYEKAAKPLMDPWSAELPVLNGETAQTHMPFLQKART